MKIVDKELPITKFLIGIVMNPIGFIVFIIGTSYSMFYHLRIAAFAAANDAKKIDLLYKNELIEKVSKILFHQALSGLIVPVIVCIALLFMMTLIRFNTGDQKDNTSHSKPIMIAASSIYTFILLLAYFNAELIFPLLSK